METNDQAILSLQQTTKKLIHIGASSIPSTYLLPHIISDFRQKHPEVHFSIWQGGSDEIGELLQNGSVDIAFTGKEVSSPMCESIKVCSDQLMLVTPATDEYRRLKESNAKISDILKHPMILRANGSGTQFIESTLLDSL